MKQIRPVLIAVLILCGVVTPLQASATPGELPLVDLAAMTIDPNAIPEAGYLLEGGGWLTDTEQVAQLHGAPGGSDTNDSDIAGSMSAHGWQRSYMSRHVLLADRTRPGSELLADEITLFHSFVSSEGASDTGGGLEDFWLDSGEEVNGTDAFATYRFVAESADSLVSVVVIDAVVAEIISTDMQRRPDIAGHETIVAATVQRMTDVAGNSAPSPALKAAFVDDMKVTTFFDSADSFQHYTVRDGRWLTSVDATGNSLPDGIETAYQSQQVVRLNNQSQIMVQVWLGSFRTAENGTAFVERPELLGDIVPMFADQGVASLEQTVGGVELRQAGATLPDGARANGYQSWIFNARGTQVGIVSLMASGLVVIDPDEMVALVTAQQDCLDAETACPTLSLDDVIVTDLPNETHGASPEGTYVDPQFGWSVDYAAAGWKVRGIESETIFEVQNGRSLATIETVVDRHGDPTRCILEEVRLLEDFENHAYITLGSDVNGESKAGKEPGHAWAIYTVEPLADERADQEYTIRLDCFTLVDETASLVIHHSAPRDLWSKESAKGDDLRANIEISGDAAAPLDDLDARLRIVDVLMPRIWIPLAA